MRTLAAVVSLAVLSAIAPAARQAPDGQRPVFRAGAHFVRVDVYPVRHGQPIAGLTAGDFELLEDGRPQAIETIEFVESPTFTTNGDRRDPHSQRGGFELARSAQYRIFVLYLDAFHVAHAGAHRVSLPVVDFLNRMIGPRDLFGVLTPAQRVDDLMLGQLTQTISQQLTDHPDWGLADRRAPQPGEEELEFAFSRHPAFARRLIALRRLDKVYADLEALVVKLGDLRDERKNVVYFSDSLPSPRSGFSDMAIDPTGRSGAPPPIVVGPGGTLTHGPRAGDVDMRAAEAERARLTSIDFDQRFRELLQRARTANVSFYTVRPGGLDMSYSLLSQGVSNLRVLADETDGAAVAGSNDVRPGLKRITDDLSSHYVLGYYTSNTSWNGGVRRITVRLKSTGERLRARREYRAPTEAEMASIREASVRASTAPAARSPLVSALDALARLRPAARIAVYGVSRPGAVAIVAEIAAAEIEAGRWKEGADVQVMITTGRGETAVGKGRVPPGMRGTVIEVPVPAGSGPWQATIRARGESPETEALSIAAPGENLLGEPIVYRAASTAASPFQPAAVFHFRRTERVRVEWPTRAAIEGHDARLLDRNGQPLAVPVTVAPVTGDRGPFLRAELNLAPLNIGDYVVEVTARAAGRSDRQMFAFRVGNAR